MEIRTFHAFFMDVVRAHGPLLTGTPPVFLPPDAESPRKADHDDDWAAETRELARRGIYVFDQLTPVAATLLERSPALRRLYSDRYPLVIVDEFRDTNLDQWRVIQALAGHSTVIMLADPDQRIYKAVDVSGPRDAMIAGQRVSGRAVARNQRTPSTACQKQVSARVGCRAAGARHPAVWRRTARRVPWQEESCSPAEPYGGQRERGNRRR